MSIKHSVYFEGNVQSLGFERNGLRATVGVFAPGEYHFGTSAPERVTVISGELAMRHPRGAGEWRVYPMGTAFEVPGNSAFDVKASAQTAYLCEFLPA